MICKDIQKLSVYEFVRLLTQENFDYIKEEYSSFEGALEVYKDNAKEECTYDDKDYLDVNDYFELDMRNLEDYTGYW